MVYEGSCMSQFEIKEYLEADTGWAQPFSQVFENLKWNNPDCVVEVMLYNRHVMKGRFCDFCFSRTGDRLYEITLFRKVKPN